MDIKIKQCPFCGCDANLYTYYSTKNNKWYIRCVCDICKSEGPAFASDEHPRESDWESVECEKAIIAWNRRAVVSERFNSIKVNITLKGYGIEISPVNNLIDFEYDVTYTAFHLFEVIGWTEKYIGYYIDKDKETVILMYETKKAAEDAAKIMRENDYEVIGKAEEIKYYGDSYIL